LIHSALKRAVGIACLAACGACAAIALNTAPPVAAIFASRFDQSTASRINELEQKKDWAGMLRLARARLRSEPENADWWFLQGYALARQGHNEAAIESFRQATRLSPEDEGSWLALGDCELQLGRPDDAIREYRQALSYRPESVAAYLALADVYRRQGKLDLAIRNLRECVRYEPDSVQGWYGLARAYQLTGQTQLRDQALLSLRKLDPAAAKQFEKQYPSK
jgi:tetratricopeptide (TPR) repeat protein